MSERGAWANAAPEAAADEESGSTETSFGSCPLLARRALLLGAGAAGLTALLSACGGDSSDNTAENKVENNPGGGAVTPTATTSGDGSLVALSEVPVGGGVIAPGEVLVVQPASGSVKAYDAHCPHKFAVVGTPDKDGVIVCPKHNARFRADDGSKIDGPGTGNLKTIEVTVRDGRVMRV